MIEGHPFETTLLDESSVSAWGARSETSRDQVVFVELCRPPDYENTPFVWAGTTCCEGGSALRGSA
jgi:hypothetical protein